MLCERPFVRKGSDVKRAPMVYKEYRDGVSPFGCGNCKPCRVNLSRVWTARILIEAMAHPFSSFVTVTYSDDYLPEGGSLNKHHFDNFLKRFRYYVEPLKIRYFGCGEYGETGRPHFHFIIFNWFPDCRTQATTGCCDQARVFCRHTDSCAVKQAWKMGRRIEVATLTRNSAKYVTGYAVKGWTSPKIDKLNGREPEFRRSSRGRGPGEGLGGPGIKKIAAKLRENPYFEKRIIKEIKKMPLGRYLTDCMSDELGITEDEKEQEYFIKQMEDVELYLDDLGMFAQNIIDAHKQKRLNAEKRRSIWQRKRVL